MKRSLKILFILSVGLFAGFIACTKSTFPTPETRGEYSVFAWSDIGMNQMDPTYDKLVLHPPQSNVVAQVVKRGDSPVIVTTGLTVSYKLTGNTTSYNKRAYKGFWDFSNKLFGAVIPQNVGLKGKGLSGNMTEDGNHFIAEAIPAVPVSDNGTWNPYQVAEITVKDATGKIVATTKATVPTSDEISCTKCHGSDPYTEVLELHDAGFGTSFSEVASQPVLCASCHPSPGIGINTGRQRYLSQVMHGSHATKTGIGCYDCHPGTITKFSRSLAHTADNGKCVECHGSMESIASSINAGRVPGTGQPSCATCHTAVTGVSTGSEPFRKSMGHGSMYCSACHGSPHAMYPSREEADNFQSKQYQGFTTKIKTIGSCGVCHTSSRGETNMGDFDEVHGATKPEKLTGCTACHTAISSNTENWPHAYTWKNSN
jgi:hypothetical protein